MSETKAEKAQREEAEAAIAAAHAAQEGAGGTNDAEGGADSPTAPKAKEKAPVDLIGPFDVHSNISLGGTLYTPEDRGVMVPDDEISRSCLAIGHLTPSE